MAATSLSSKPIIPLMTNMSAWHAGSSVQSGANLKEAPLSDREIQQAHSDEAKNKANVFFEDPPQAWAVRGLGYLRSSKAEGKGKKHAASFVSTVHARAYSTSNQRPLSHSTFVFLSLPC